MTSTITPDMLVSVAEARTAGILLRRGMSRDDVVAFMDYGAQAAVGWISALEKGEGREGCPRA